MSERLKRYQVKISELCFYVFFVSLLFAKGIGLYDGQTLFKVFLLIALCGWAMKTLLTEYTWGELFLCGLITLLGGIIYLNTHEKGALFCLLLVCGVKDVQVKRVFRVGLVTWILSFGSLFLVTSLHLIDSPFKVHDKLGLGRIIRWSLGYAHPNVLHISFLVLACFVVYLLQDRFRIRSFLILMLMNLYVFLYSLSSTGFLAVSILLILALYWSFRRKFCRLEKIGICLCLPLCLLLSLAAPLLLNGEAFEVVNRLVNTRLALSRWFLQNQPVRPFGVDTTGLVTSLRTMDNSYVFAWITYGFLFLAFMTGAYMILIYRKAKCQDGVSACLILSCLIAGITEPFLFNTSFKNITLIFVGAMLFGGNKRYCGKKAPLFGRLDRELTIILPDFAAMGKEMWEVSRSYRKTLAAAGIMAGIVTGVLCFINADMPKRYILPQTAFEETGDLGEFFYLESGEDIPMEGDRVMGYVSKDTAMVGFSGNIARVERVRNMVGGAVVTAFSVYGLGMIYLWIKEKRDEKKAAVL